MAAVRREMPVRLLGRPLAVLTVLVLVFKTGPSSLGLVIAGGLAFYALLGVRQAVESLILLGFLLLLGGGGLALGRWIVLFASFVSIVVTAPKRALAAPLTSVLGVFCMVVMLLALVGSWLPVVSLLKLTSFAVGLIAILTGFTRTPHLRDYWLCWFFTLSVFMLLSSFPLYFSGLGYLRNGEGFQGITGHPQTFGPVLAPMAALLTGLYLFHGHRSRLLAVCIPLVWLGMYFSLARTAILAAVLGLGITLGLGLVRYSSWQRAVTRAFARPAVQASLALFLALLVVRGPTIRDAAVSFLMKGKGTSIAESLQGSRGTLVERSIANFRSAPLTGIGFGIPSDTSRLATTAGGNGFNLPVAASAEKGFLPTAVLEELGILGVPLCVMLLVAVFGPIYRHGSLTIFWVALCCLLINLGEMVFFSLGGMGLYFWAVMLMCYQHAVVPHRALART